MNTRDRPKKDHNILVRVEEDVYKATEEYASADRVPMSQIVRTALYRYLKDRKDGGRNGAV